MSFPCGNHQNSRNSSTHLPSTPLLRRPGNGHGQHMVVIDVPAIMPCAAIPVKMVPGAIDFLPAGGRAAFVLPQTLPLSIFRPHVIPCPRQADIPPAADMAIAAVRAAMNFDFIGVNSLITIIWSRNGNGPPLIQSFNAIPEAEGKGDIPPYKSSGICYNPKDLQPPRHHEGTRDSSALALQF